MGDVGQVLPPPYRMVDNGESLLDVTDLVFIDPVDTGYSRATGSSEDIRNRYFNVGGDIDYLSDVIARWLNANGRMPSPKFYVGESYGGFRGPLIAHKLQTDIGVGLSGLVLLSPVLDFNAFSQPRHAPWSFVARLPSYAAAALERKGPVTRETLAEAERYAATDYLVDLTRGLQDVEAVDRVSRRVAELTGLNAALVRRYGGRVTMNAFQREFDRASGRVVSAYDTGVSSHDPEPTAHIVEIEDPVLTAMTAPLTSAIVDHLARTLKFTVNAPYHLLNGAVNGHWRWSRGRGQPESVSDLRKVMALDGKLRVLVAHGLTDLVTPYFASQLILNQLPDFGPDRRITLSAYAGGHMFYSRDASRRAFREDGLRLYRAALEGRATDQTKL
jgi:carboxypeptidase C (cathepsin A)